MQGSTCHPPGRSTLMDTCPDSCWRCASRCLDIGPTDKCRTHGRMPWCLASSAAALSHTSACCCRWCQCTRSPIGRCHRCRGCRIEIGWRSPQHSLYCPWSSRPKPGSLFCAWVRLGIAWMDTDHTECLPCCCLRGQSAFRGHSSDWSDPHNWSGLPHQCIGFLCMRCKIPLRCRRTPQGTWHSCLRWCAGALHHSWPACSCWTPCWRCVQPHNHGTLPPGMTTSLLGTCNTNRSQAAPVLSRNSRRCTGCLFSCRLCTRSMFGHKSPNSQGRKAHCCLCKCSCLQILLVRVSTARGGGGGDGTPRIRCWHHGDLDDAARCT